MHTVSCVLRWMTLFALAGVAGACAQTARQVVARAILAEEGAEREKLIGTLAALGDPEAKPLLDAWREDALFIFEPAPGVKTPVQLVGDKDARESQDAVRVEDGKPLLDSASQPLRLVAADLTAVEHDMALRRAMSAVKDMLDLAAPSHERRILAIQPIGQSQDPAKLNALQARLPLETHPKVQVMLREAIALIQLKDPDDSVKVAALKELKALHRLSSRDFVYQAQKAGLAEKKSAVATAAKDALTAIDSHVATVNFFGTIFRGISAGSILLVVALGLTITFGLMRVINMAHGEMMVIGAYTTYIVQCVFGQGLALSPFGFSLSIPGINATGSWYDSYFLFALPLSFLTAATVGIALERSIIQFLYRRPLESLLATSGVSLVLQQLFKLVFGANNVPMNAPSYLSGNFTVNDVLLGWNRLFVIGFAILIVLGVWLLLTKTSLGLLIRAVMQNRSMASCMGIRTERVNMATFGLGSGLAGLAGAFLSQIANVGPSLGQNYIVDCFMTVVVGGVGNLAGTIISATGIGTADQSLQQLLGNPVLGKILVLVGIILFLQWRPAGIFVTRSRSLDD